MFAKTNKVVVLEVSVGNNLATWDLQDLDNLGLDGEAVFLAGRIPT